jgi:hypothetical protein
MGSKSILGRLTGRVWSGFTWLRIGIGGGLLWTRWWTVGFWHHGVSMNFKGIMFTGSTILRTRRTQEIRREDDDLWFSMILKDAVAASEGFCACNVSVYLFSECKGSPQNNFPYVFHIPKHW